jgi:hypothetical protein
MTSSLWQPVISHHFTFNIVNIASLTCGVIRPWGPTGVQTYHCVTEYSWKFKFKQGNDSIICTSSVIYILVFLHILWYAVLSVGELCLQNWLFKSHYYGMRKPQVWEIMHLNKNNFWILNSPVVSMSLSLPNAISQDTTLCLSKGKVPPRNWMGGQHTRMEIMQADVLLILLFSSTGLSHHPQPIQEKCLYC